MKNLLLLVGIVLSSGCFAQTTIEDAKSTWSESVDTMSQETKQLMVNLLEYTMTSAIDSMVNEGMYTKALEMLDTMQANWKKITGMDFSERMYLTKGNLLQHLEEWEDLAAMIQECTTVHKESLDERIAPILYSLQGNAYRNLEKYRQAIGAYESSSFYYKKKGDIGSQGDIFCSMALCYTKLEKYSMATSFYEKGLQKFLEYFETSRASLLRSELKVKDEYKQTLLGVFGCHLYNMALFQQDYGTRDAMREYLLMSAHCGHDGAKSEYKRIFRY